MTDVTIYHNPKCTKSRQTLELLESRGITPRIVPYLDTPPSATELDRILRLLNKEPRDIMRKQEPEYAALGLDNSSLTRSQLIEAMVQHPRLIERPIVVTSGKATIGRPPENVLAIL